jgi:hypothetical protein
MKALKYVIGIAVLGLILATPVLALAGDQSPPAQAKNVKPYTLKTCIVSGEKLDGEMGKPYVFVHEGQEIKLCCKSCLKDFNKESARYLKKLAEAQKDGKQKAPSAPATDHRAHGGHNH